MSEWLDGQGRFFNPNPRVSLQPLFDGRVCVVIDDALADPAGLRIWAAEQRFGPPAGYPYPGIVCEVPGAMNARIGDYFALHVRKHLGVRRTSSLASRLSVIDTAPQDLAPIQWLCHRDRLVHDASHILFAACVLYLFDDVRLGGTSFYRPRLSQALTEELVAHSQSLAPHDFSARYGLRPGYMDGSNAYFEQVARVPARWNRIIFYDGGLFHSADVGDAALMQSDPLRGRLTLNSFLTCRKSAA